MVIAASHGAMCAVGVIWGAQFCGVHHALRSSGVKMSANVDVDGPRARFPDEEHAGEVKPKTKSKTYTREREEILKRKEKDTGYVQPAHAWWMLKF